MTLATELSQGLTTLDLPLSATQQGLLLDYLTLLAKWNKVYNLTAVREPDSMLRLHLLDSLAALPPRGP
ncbi:MAG: RsmG family class I SAM-dependent methyltransferase, partial [Inhella sp.]